MFNKVVLEKKKKILAFQNPRFKILTFQTPDLKILAEYKILAFQNGEFKFLALQNPDFKMWCQDFRFPTSLIQEFDWQQNFSILKS